MLQGEQWTGIARAALACAALALAGCSSEKRGGSVDDADVPAAQMGDGDAGRPGADGELGGTADDSPGAGNDGDGGPARAPAGDGDGTAPAPGCPDGTNHVGGTRVQARMLVTEEGDRAFLRHFDVERGAPCDFNTAADGSLRCLPNNWSDSETYFLDAACTMPVYTEAAQGPCEPAGVVWQWVDLPGGCGQGMRVLELGAEVTPTSPLYILSGDRCIEGSAPDVPLHAAGAEIPSTSFPLGEDQQLERVGRLAPVGVRSDDGAFRLRGWSDTGLDGYRCLPQSQAGEVLCMPPGLRLERTSSTRYADASCETPLYPRWSGLCGSPPVHATEYPEAGCSADPHRVWRVGDAHVDPVYAAGDACQADVAPDGTTLHAMTELAVGELVRFEQRIDDTDTGRLRRRHLTTDEGGCWAESHWDSELDVPCRFSRAADGRWRCLPEGTLSTYAGFADAACTIPAAFASVPTCKEPVELPRFVRRTDYQGCRQVTVYEVVGQLAEAPTLYRDDAGTCVESSVAPASSWLELTPVEPERFMAAEVQ